MIFTKPHVGADCLSRLTGYYQIEAEVGIVPVWLLTAADLLSESLCVLVIPHLRNSAHLAIVVH